MTLPRKSAFLCEGRYLIANTRVLVRRQLLDRRTRTYSCEGSYSIGEKSAYSCEGSYSIGEKSAFSCEVRHSIGEKSAFSCEDGYSIDEQARSRAKMGTR